jgi:hypothetical protein
MNEALIAQRNVKVFNPDAASNFIIQADPSAYSGLAGLTEETCSLALP